MTGSVTTASPLVLLASTGAALADPGEGWGSGFGHMKWGVGFGAFGGLMMIAFWGAIIALIVFAVRGFSTSPGSAGKSDAGEILRERYARGEIDEEEYEGRKAKLES